MKKILFIVIILAALVFGYMYLDQNKALPKEVVDIAEKVDNNIPDTPKLPLIQEENTPEEPVIEEEIEETVVEEEPEIEQEEESSIEEETTEEEIIEDIVQVIVEENEAEEPPKEQKTIVAFGDSLTEGFGIPEEDSYPSQLQDKLNEEGYEHYTVINHGVSGDTTWQAKERLQNVIDENPDIVIVVIGANDAFSLFEPSTTKENIEEMVYSLQEENITVILGGMQVLGGISTSQAVDILMERLGVPKEYAEFVYAGMNYVENFNAIYPKLDEDLDVTYIPFFLKGVAANPQLNIEDGIHPTKEGYTIILEDNLWPVLLPLLE